MWTLTNRKFAVKHFTHFVYVSGAQCAIADHSIRNMSDPSSTDDGLLLVDDSRTIALTDNGAFVAVVKINGEESWVNTKWENVQLIRKYKDQQLGRMVDALCATV